MNHSVKTTRQLTKLLKLSGFTLNGNALRVLDKRLQQEDDIAGYLEKFLKNIVLKDCMWYIYLLVMRVEM